MAFSTHDQVPDSPTNVFATWNVLVPTNGTFSEGNILFTASSSAPSTTNATISMTSGKWYCEILYKGANNWTVGIVADNRTRNYLGMSDNSTSVSIWPYPSATDVYVNAASISWSGSATTWANGDIVSMLVDANVQSITFYKNGTSIGAVSYSSYGWDTAYFAVGNYISGTDYHVNFGQDHTFGGTKSPSSTYTDANGIGSFYYQPPTGALALCTANLPDSDIDPNADDLPEDYMKAVTWTGGQLTNNQVTGVGFQPDLIWSKERSGVGYHRIHDSVRGASAGQLISNTTAAQNSSYPLGSFDSDGFTISSALAQYDNTTNKTYVGWCWKAGGAPSGSTSTTGSAKRINTSGTQDDTSCSALATAASATITPTLMSINQKAGFSIVMFNATGSTATVPHGLTKAPEMIIAKQILASSAWSVYSERIGSTKRLRLDTSDPESTDVGWGNTAPNSTVFTQNLSGSQNSIIAYCWHSVAGYSKFGSYTGNGSTDGPFVYTGFKPALLLIKMYSGGTDDSWVLLDNVRDVDNAVTHTLYPNLPNNESSVTNHSVDFLSNGFKFRANGQAVNNSSRSYIYAAFAEQPFKYANAR